MLSRVVTRLVTGLLIPALLIDASWAVPVKQSPQSSSAYSVQAIPPTRGFYANSRRDFDVSLNSFILRLTSLRYSLGQFLYPSYRRLLPVAVLLAVPVFLKHFELPGEDLAFFSFQSTVMVGLFLGVYALAYRKRLSLEDTSRVLSTVWEAVLTLVVLWPVSAVLHEIVHAMLAWFWEPSVYVVIPGWQQFVLFAMAVYGGLALFSKTVRARGLKPLAWKAVVLTTLGYLSYAPQNELSPLETLFGRSPGVEALRTWVIQSNPLGSFMHLFQWGAAVRQMHVPNTYWGPTQGGYPYETIQTITHGVYLVPHFVQAFLSIVLFRHATQRRSLLLQIVAFGLAAYPTFGGTVIDYFSARDTSHALVPEFYVMSFVWWVAWEVSNITGRIRKRWLRSEKKQTPDSLPLMTAGIFFVPLAIVITYEFSLHRTLTTWEMVKKGDFIRWLSDVFHLNYSAILIGIGIYAVTRGGTYWRRSMGLRASA